MAMTDFHKALEQEQTGLFGVLQALIRNGDVLRALKPKALDNWAAWVHHRVKP